MILPRRVYEGNADKKTPTGKERTPEVGVPVGLYESVKESTIKSSIELGAEGIYAFFLFSLRANLAVGRF